MVNVFKKVSHLFILGILLIFPQAANSAEGDKVRHKPFIYAYSSDVDMEATASKVRASLSEAGFTIAGEYSPYDGVLGIAVTNSALQAATSTTDFGNFAAVLRVSITKMGENIQVAYVNPTYLALAYRLSSDLGEAKASLQAALGADHVYGSKKGVTVKKLRKYRYMGFPMFTERFDKPDLLAKYASHEEAVAKVEEGLAAGAGGVSKVYRVDIEGTNNTLFGVGMTDGCSADTHIMTKIDFEDQRSSAHLPYEVLVKDNEVWALGARFRIAISFPDLKMVGKHSFAGIMCAPGAIKNALKAASGNPKKKKKSRSN
jgi:hypothetical protein